MKRIIPIAWWLVALIAVATILLYAEADFLWKVQQNNLFLSTPLFFKQQMVVPGGMLSYLGTFFTQFFYYPWLGVVLLCGWWLLLTWLTKKAFQIPDKASVVALVPVAVLLVANMQLGYWIYLMKLPGYFFVPTIGTTAGVALLWTFRRLPEKLWWRIAFIVLVALAGYPLMGAYALATVVVMAVWTWRLSKQHTLNGAVTGVGLLSVIATPLIYYHLVYYQTNIQDIYRVAIPDFTITETLSAFYHPYYLLPVCFLAFALAYRPWKVKATTPIWQWLLQGAFLAALAAGVWHYWYKDANFHQELGMERCVEQADWEGVVEVGKKQAGEPTRSIVMMHNLALSRLGRQCDEMYRFPKGSKRSNTELPMYLYSTVGRQIFYHYGVMNECHRRCMEEGVEYGWSVELLQYMARCAVLCKETQVARKYLDLLRETLFYGAWADHMESMLSDNTLLTNDKETGPITHMMHYPDMQGKGDEYVEKNLMTMLSMIDSDDPYFQEQAVLAAMWTRNSDVFWPRFEQYVNQHPYGPIPRIIQEAAYLFANMQQQDFINELPIDDNVKSDFQGFMKVMQQCQGKPDMQARQYLLQYYGTTYYFEYFFLRGITYF